MRFIPAVVPISEANEPEWWFLFREYKLLVKKEGEAFSIPYLEDLETFNLSPVRTQYLGTLDGRPCYSGELADHADPPPGMAFQGLRSLFESMGPELFGLAGRAFQIVDWDRTNQFCSRCGEHVETKSDERAKVCPKCGMLNYPRLSPAVIVAVLKENQILLARNGRFPNGFYSVLAGFVEPGETFEDCVKREVKEEVGLEVKNIRYFGSQPWPFPNSVMIGFIADYDKGEITIDGNEIKDAGWFPASDLPLIPGKISIARQLIDWFLENYQ
ncbi:MAG: NAD(+) diphosphatase [Deltaproteobacteria bacterium]|nr:NAD(+) diphosphatase [Deltaproteobacteria bacterium]MBW2051549.1 NAD(+) diphosphatase [Deltaproteobacteria bacterium]MBW2140114.1 NAD(+) diphosphatase [Deltaproteobacteria bacterium]MBW2322039.1 NAD(+) diphosphatase [Deltaproteobacteria bacterium]